MEPVKLCSPQQSKVPSLRRFSSLPTRRWTVKVRWSCSSVRLKSICVGIECLPINSLPVSSAHSPSALNFARAALTSLRAIKILHLKMLNYICRRLCVPFVSLSVKERTCEMNHHSCVCLRTRLIFIYWLNLNLSPLQHFIGERACC